jgi:hypothetical protein
MSLQACADIVAKSDPDRFAAAMAAPVAARRVLFPIYAFNAEVTKAAWIASEPMIGEMRLQWWRDALEEIGQGRAVRKHEVATPLGEVLLPEAAATLDKMVQARRWDLYKDPFEDEGHLLEYLSATGGALMWAGAQTLGALSKDAEEVVRGYGQAAGFVRFMSAVPELEAMGRVPLLDGRASAVALLAEQIWELRPLKQSVKRHVPRVAQAALLEGWQTYALLARVMKTPTLVADGALKLSEFEKRARLIKASISGFV